VIAQAEVKTILKSSGEKYKKLREAGKPLYQISANTMIKESVKPAPEVVKEAPKDTEGDVSSLLESIGTFDAAKDKADDLKKVKGIGPKMEKTLNQIGIFTFAQVSRMTNREYNLLDSITGSFPGRAQRDDWAGQAKELNNK
jgi:molybdopterin-containing oxidoreductase family membrane subunit